MPTVAIARPRAPRGTKILTQAFFAALSDIPEPQQEAVGKAALAAIKEMLQIKKEKAKSVATRLKPTTKLRQSRNPKSKASSH